MLAAVTALIGAAIGAIATVAAVAVQARLSGHRRLGTLALRAGECRERAQIPCPA